MKTQRDKVIDKITATFKEGEIFTLHELSELTKVKKSSLSWIISDAIELTLIDRIGRGKYYIPKKTRFGTLKPSDSNIIQFVVDEIYKNTGSRPYFASNTIYQKLGLTTQVSNEVFLISNRYNKSKIEIGNILINILPFKGNWSKKQVRYLEILYAIDNIKDVPDTNIEESYKILFSHVKKLSTKEIIQLIECSILFKASARALLGTMVSQLGYKIASDKLRDTIGLESKFYCKINDNIIDKKIKTLWRIYEPA